MEISKENGYGVITLSVEFNITELMALSDLAIGLAHIDLSIIDEVAGDRIIEARNLLDNIVAEAGVTFMVETRNNLFTLSAAAKRRANERVEQLNKHHGRVIEDLPYSSCECGYIHAEEDEGILDDDDALEEYKGPVDSYGMPVDHNGHFGGPDPRERPLG